MRYLDLYGLFVDEQTGRRSMNVPGTDDFWVGDENMLSKNPSGGLDGTLTVKVTEPKEPEARETAWP